MLATVFGCQRGATGAATPAPPPAPDGQASAQSTLLDSRELHRASGGSALPMSQKTTRLRLGAGWFVHQQIQTRARPCPVQESPLCAMFAIFDGKSWGPVRQETLGVYAFSAHGDRVLVAHRGGIDELSSDGTTRPWSERFSLDRRFASFSLLDTESPALVAATPDLQRYQVEGATMHHLVADAQTLEFSRVEVATAHEARQAAPLRPIWGQLHAAAIPGTQRWALVVTEVTPPPPGSRVGQKFERRGKAKHECGAAVSRPLSDPSVHKARRLVIYQESRKVTERLLQEGTDLDGERDPIALAVGPRTVTVNGQSFDADGREKGKGKPIAEALPETGPLPLTLTEDETLTGLSFDLQAGEGLATVRDGELRAFAVRFGASPGELRGELPLPQGFGDHHQRIFSARHGEAWLLFDPVIHELLWLTGPRAGERQKTPEPMDYLCGDLLLARSNRGIERYRVQSDGKLLDLGALPVVATGRAPTPGAVLEGLQKEDHFSLDPPTRGELAWDALKCDARPPTVELAERKGTMRLDTGQIEPAPAEMSRSKKDPTESPYCTDRVSLKNGREAQGCVEGRGPGARRKAVLCWFGPG